MMVDRTRAAQHLISAFAERTGLVSMRSQRRYLWTDAFALTASLGLAQKTGDGRYAELAAKLVEDVHHELGRHRKDDARHGWLSGLGEAEGRKHPTTGGLRIGKPLPERGPGEPLDRELEWERDGQYFHYLTKWAHALDQAARWRNEPTFHLWARELMATAHGAFTYGSPGARRMVWKRSVDLSRSLVSAMGQHDPVDGLVTCLELEQTARELDYPPSPRLDAAIAEFRTMVEPAELATDDPLGIGGLLIDAARLTQIDRSDLLLRPIVDAAVVGLRRFLVQPDLRGPASARLAFRELGLAIGLAGVALLLERRRGEDAALAALVDYVPLRDEIEGFWLDAAHRRAPTWTQHEDISDVMLATSLVPDGFICRSASEPSER